ncbi:putative Ser/Thr protein kinase [Nonomuraea muscovyensis]|uniref:non-specific serine/threonine protein kinase n=1 Tax=Nonomuraea muscovyensis TaxID=1124761 RepID=A0A7X0BVR6_9ACTN|nr:serine/threonine-protein kinase [Nonomuraea muscovyensis]MBB6343642.1 putative Ser/Thr protein kinase [Nonomuraea muscovyensis]
MPQVEPLRDGDPAAMGPYRLLGRLGAGGQGVVYLGQYRDAAPVAVKVLHESVAGDDRLAREIAAARRVEPFCVAQVLDASFAGRPYVVTEYVDGPSLQQAGRHHGAELQRLAVATATALAAIHQAGVVHRDFKPANVLLGPGGPRVIDFGVARALDAGGSATSGIVGTPAYMAPEQLAGTGVGPPADVFAWASVIVFAATGTPPFGDDSLPAVINRILHNEPQLGDLAQPLRDVVLACLAKDPARRPAMQDVLLRLIGGRYAPPFQGPRPGPDRFGPGDSPPGPVRPGGTGPPPFGPGGGAGPSGPGGRDPFRPAGDGSGPFGAGDGGPATRPSRRRGRGGPAVIAAASAATALALGGALLWLEPWAAPARLPVTGNLAGASPVTPPPATRTPSRTPRPKRTARPRPTPSATVSRTPTRRSTTGPRATTTSARPTVRTSSARPVSGGGVRLLFVRSVGSWHADPGCYAGGDVLIQAKVERTGSGTRPIEFRYTWYFDGKAAGSGTSLVVDDTNLFNAPRSLQPAAGGGTRVASVRITSPGTAQKSVSVKFCEEETP